MTSKKIGIFHIKVGKLQYTIQFLEKFMEIVDIPTDAKNKWFELGTGDNWYNR